MNGRRLPDSQSGELRVSEPGDYQYDAHAGRWYGITPNGLLFVFNDGHQLSVEADGALTVSPSILVTHDWESQGRTWHGFLASGEWRAA